MYVNRITARGGQIGVGLFMVFCASGFAVAQQVGINTFSATAIHENFDSFPATLLLTNEVPSITFVNSRIINGPFCPSPPQVFGPTNDSMPQELLFHPPAFRVGFRWDMDGACCGRLPRAEFYDTNGVQLGTIATGNPGGPFGGWQHSSGIGRVIITNSLGTSGDGFDDLILDPLGPVVVSQPVSQLVCSSSDATFAVASAGVTPLTFRWQFENWNLPGTWLDLQNGLNQLPDSVAVFALGVSTNSMTIGHFSFGTFRPTEVRLRCRLTNSVGANFSNTAVLTISACDCIDFNNDGSSFDPQDIDAFLSTYAEGPCIPEAAVCNDIDFNNDGSVFDPCDIDSFLLVFSEGPCSACGI